MKTKILIGIISVLFTVLFLFSFKGKAQEPVYNDKVDDAELDKKETEAQKKVKTNEPDPYYNQYIKDSWDKQKEDKAKKIIDEIKKEYGAEKFDKATIEKGPIKKEGKEGDSKLYKAPPADPVYEKEIKNSYTKENDELKKEILRSIKEDLGLEKKKEGNKEDKTAPSGIVSDPYYEKEIKNSWDKQREEVIEKAKKMLQDEKLIIKEDEKKKKEEEKKKQDN